MLHVIGERVPSYEKLQAQKESLYADYGKLKKQVQEYDVIKRNEDSTLQAGKKPEQERERKGKQSADSSGKIEFPVI